jgi:hypothetical protein
MKNKKHVVGYAKRVNFEHLYLLNVLAIRSKKSLSEHFYKGKICIDGFVQMKRGAFKK